MTVMTTFIKMFVIVDYIRFTKMVLVLYLDITKSQNALLKGVLVIVN